MVQLLFLLLGFVVIALKIYSGGARNAVSFRKPIRMGVQEMEMRKYLEQIAFFKTLNSEDQHTFVQRIQYYLEQKDFQGMNGQVITDEIRTIVAASAVQVSFRLPLWKFPSFNTFRIYPESFYSHLFRKYLKGGAGNTGQVWFSLRDYREGFAHADNGINLGLHEMAHALIIEMQNGNLDHEFTHAYEAIEKIAADRIPKIRAKQFTYLREYAGTNEMEFIAVTTEYFFEQPEKLSAAERELYEAFAALYRQDPIPATRTSIGIIPINYEEIEEEEKVKRNYRFSKWHWSLTLVLLGIFIAPFFLAHLMQQVTLSFETCWMVAFGVLIFSSVFLYKPIVKSGGLSTTQFILCHIFGLWPLVFATVMLLNNCIPVWAQGDVQKIRTVRWPTQNQAVINYADPYYNEDPGFYTVNVPKNTLKPGDYIIVVTQYGLFGIPTYGKHIPLHIERMH